MTQTDPDQITEIIDQRRPPTSWVKYAALAAVGITLIVCAYRFFMQFTPRELSGAAMAPLERSATLTKRFLEDGVAVAVRSDVELFRAALRGFHMLEDPQAWLKRPANLAKVMGYWARGRARNAEAYRPRGGPEREDMLRGLGLEPELDVQRVLAEAGRSA